MFREIRAGLTTFATMAYIIAVNVSGGHETRCTILLLTRLQATIISQTGGSCECNRVDRLTCDDIAEYTTCKEGGCNSIA